MKDFERPDGERRLAAIMFTDMVGFTALAQRDEGRAMELLDEQRKLIRACLVEYKGREIEAIGDAFFCRVCELAGCGQLRRGDPIGVEGME